VGTTTSVSSPDAKLMYTTAAHKDRTIVTLWRDGRKTRSVRIPGWFGMPLATNDGTAEGLSHDGRTLLLSSSGGPTSAFAVLDAHTLQLRRVVKLHGQFFYDALSPTGRTLYLIQFTPSLSGVLSHYYVRAYDLAQGRLLRQIVSDEREKAGPMSGTPITRVTGPSGRWVYTLYVRPNGHLFVHALDSVDRHAFCVDLTWHGSAPASWTMRLKLRPGKLLVVQSSARVAVIDTKTLRVTA